MHTYDKPYFNGVDYIVAQKNEAGLTVYRHKFETKEEAERFWQSHTEQQKPKAAENKIMKGSQENKGLN